MASNQAISCTIQKEIDYLHLMEPALDDKTSPYFGNVLRVSNEPYSYFTESQIHAALIDQPQQYLSHLRNCLESIAEETARLNLPAKKIFTDIDTDGDFRVMPCVIEYPDRTVKTVKLVGTNTLQQVIPDQITVGKAFMINEKENFISHIFEGCLLSSARTGACAALAAERLGKDSRKLVIIGAGRVGYYSALYISTLLPVNEILIHDLDDQRARECAEQLASQLIDCDVSASQAMPDESCDILVLATTSQTSIYQHNSTPARLVISLGADTDNQHEVNQYWATRAKLYVDTLDSQRYGDLREWLNAGLITSLDLTDLFTVIRKGINEKTEQPRLFISTGTALFDNMTIDYLVHGCREFLPS